MSIKTRRILFYFFLTLFVVLGSFAVFYSRGVRVDFDDLRLVKAGGIYVSSNPLDAEIELDDKMIKNKAGLIQKGTLLTLVPDFYDISVSAEGYSTWSKRVEVESGDVAVFDSIILAPEQEAVLVKAGLFDQVASQNNDIALQSPRDIQLNGTQAIGHEIIELTERSSLITKSRQTHNYYLTNSFSPNESLNLSLIFNNLKINQLNLPGAITLQKVRALSDDGKKLAIATKGALYTLDTDQLSLNQIAFGVNEFFVQKNEPSVVWAEDGKLVSYNSNFYNKTVEMEVEDFGPILEVIRSNYGWLLLESSGRLSLVQNDKIAQIANNISNISLSPNGTKLFALNSNARGSVYSLSDLNKRVDLEVDGIRQYQWHESGSYLVILGAQGLYFNEISKGLPLNKYRVAERAQGFSYSPENNLIYFINEEGLFEYSLSI